MVRTGASRVEIGQAEARRRPLAVGQAEAVVDLDQAALFAFCDRPQDKAAPNAEFHQVGVGSEQISILLSVVAQMLDMEEIEQFPQVVRAREPSVRFQERVAEGEPRLISRRARNILLAEA